MLQFMLLCVICVPRDVHGVKVRRNALGTMLMELLDVPDDNLTMPIVAGASMTLATLALH